MEDTLAKAGFNQEIAADISQSFIEGTNIEVELTHDNTHHTSVSHKIIRKDENPFGAKPPIANKKKLAEKKKNLL